MRGPGLRQLGSNYEEFHHEGFQRILFGLNLLVGLEVNRVRRFAGHKQHPLVSQIACPSPLRRRPVRLQPCRT